MNPLEVTQSGRPLKVADVTAYEKRIGFKLPPDYKAFLLTSNGGKPLRNHVKHGTRGL